MLVTETIRVVAAGDQIKRGIYRDFPQQLYRTKSGLERFGLRSLLRQYLRECLTAG